MKEYIKTSANEALKNRNELYLLSGSIPVYILNKLPTQIDFNNVIKILEKYIPASILTMIEGIYVGEFKELKDRNIQAMFKDGVIYLSSFKNNPNVSEKAITKDICHELGHAVEDNLGKEIYADGKIEKEFNGKKQKLFSLLAHEGYHFAKEILFEPRLIDHLDDLLYKEIGYDKLSLIIPGLFTSPYSITSIREYFANGLEDYLLGDQKHLKKMCSALYNKINSICDEMRFSA
jgi:hypothetical protein